MIIGKKSGMMSLPGNRAVLMVRALVLVAILAVAIPSGATHPSLVEEAVLDAVGLLPDGRTLYNVGHTDAIGFQVGDRLYGAEVLGVVEEISMVTLAVNDPLRFERRMESDPAVLWLEADSLVAVKAHQAAAPNDPRFSSQWGLQAGAGIHAVGAWTVTMGDASVKVAILDSGIDSFHEDLQGSVIKNADCHSMGVCVEDISVDTCEHGTHVAGIVGARTGNGIGMAGVAQVSLIDVKVLALGAGGCSGPWGGLARGIVFAVNQGADIISMSLGGNVNRVSSVEQAVAFAEQNDVLLISSAGNSGCSSSDTVGYPAHMAGVMAVANHNVNGVMAGSSSCGPQVEISAPGSSIWSTCAGVIRYCTKSGTSMSAPHVSGVAALMMSHDPDLTAQEVREALKQTAMDLGQPAHRQGAGAVNACKALGGGSLCS
jgi:thermitase